MPTARATLGPTRRLTHALEFQAVFEAKLRKTGFGVALSARPNGLPNHRLGLSISKAVGNAVMRTRYKRLIREAFRLHQHELPKHLVRPRANGVAAGIETFTCFDWVVALRPNCPQDLDGFVRTMLTLAAECHDTWARRDRRATPPVLVIPISVKPTSGSGSQ